MTFDAPIQIRLDGSGRRAGRWSFDAGTRRHAKRLWCDSADGVARFQTGDNLERTWADPLEALAWLDDSARCARQGARWIGYLSYDLGRYFERLPHKAQDDLGLPLFAFVYVESESDPKSSLAISNTTHSPGRLESGFTRAAYLRAVQRSIDYVAAGDIFQVNLAQRFSTPMRASPAEIYARLQSKSPASFAGLLDFGPFALISNSPELFLRVERSESGSRKVTNRPIKGTRPRRPGMDVELRDSLKDQAELNMIVDLERNDLGRVCEIGSVKVTEPRVIEAHPTVYHGVATVEGRLRDDVGLVDLLRATFPCGSITGAPKIRAMEIIDELEPVRRGPYCGAIGWLGGGEMEFSVTIRTIVATRGTAHISVGGGIVADSVPEQEYDETLVKARAMFDALGVRADDPSFRTRGDSTSG